MKKLFLLILLTFSTLAQSAMQPIPHVSYYPRNINHYTIIVTTKSSQVLKLQKSYQLEVEENSPLDNTNDPGNGAIMSGHIISMGQSVKLQAVLGYEEGEHIVQLAPETTYSLEVGKEQSLGKYKVSDTEEVEILIRVLKNGLFHE